MNNPFEDLRQAVVVRPMNSPGPQGAAAPEMKVQYSNDGSSWHNDPVDTDRYLRFSTNNGISWSDAVYFNNLAETLEWVEKARQWAENPENAEVEPGQYSALHHALQAKKAEITAGEYAIDAAGSANEAFGAAAPAWDSETVYSYNDVVSFDNGHTYRCIGTDIVGADHAPNIDGVDNVEEWTRITVSPDGYFEVDENGDLMPMITPITSEIFMLDENGDIMHQEPIDAEIAESYGRLEFVDSLDDFRSSSFVSTTKYVWLDGLTGPGSFGSGLYWRDNLSVEEDDGYNVIVDNDNVRWKRFDSSDSGNAETFVNSIDDLRNSSFSPTTEYVYVSGYYGAGTPGGGLFYKDPESLEADNGGTIIVDSDGIRWKRANVHEMYYASWFGVSTDIDDNSPLIQNALEVIPSGSVLVFGPGIYECKQTITLPDHPTNTSRVKEIALQGSVIKAGYSYQNGTRLQYTGSTQGALTPFLDFRGSDGKRYTGAIRDMMFMGTGMTSNIVGLWFWECVGSTFEHITSHKFQNGIQIDDAYYYSNFNDMVCSYCDYGFKALAHGVYTSFNYCIFRNSNIGFASNTGIISFNDCYFENNGIGIKSSLIHSIHITRCRFEEHYQYAIDLSCLNTDYSPLIILKGCYFCHEQIEIPSNISIIRLELDTGIVASCVIEDNVMHKASNPIDYFIYVVDENGDVIIKAENNIPYPITETPFLICSKTPLETSYFNNQCFS